MFHRRKSVIWDDVLGTTRGWDRIFINPFSALQHSGESLWIDTSRIKLKMKPNCQTYEHPSPLWLVWGLAHRSMASPSSGADVLVSLGHLASQSGKENK